MQLDKKEIKFETLKKSHKKQIIIGVVLVCIVGGVLTFRTTRAKYKVTDRINIVNSVVNYKVPDLRIVAVNVSEEGTNYNIQDDIPTGDYTLNSDKSVCRVFDGSTSPEEAPIDENITIEYIDGKVNILGLSKRNTRCYLYFDKIPDTTKPTISEVTTSVTETAINITVNANDDKGVTEYWYQIDSKAAVKGTGNTHQFTGLTAGTTHTIKVYVKDAAGNQSATTTKTVTTTAPTASEKILSGITVNTTTPTFSNVATTDEGVFKVADGMYGGYSYYWRGAVLNNHVIFADKCWRIIRINGDESIRLIYNGAVLTGNKCTGNGVDNSGSIAVNGQKYNTREDNGSYVGWTYKVGYQRPSATTSGTEVDSNAKVQTETWYNSNIGNNETYASKIADGKFCNDRNTQNNEEWIATGSTNYSPYVRANQTYKPTLSCSTGDVYTLKVGLITVDEVMYAGGKDGLSNFQFYLYNRQYYWTMSPKKVYNGYPHVYSLAMGNLGNDGSLVTNTSIGLRPVINLKVDVMFSSGNGLQDTPYIVQ